MNIVRRMGAGWTTEILEECRFGRHHNDYPCESKHSTRSAYTEVCCRNYLHANPKASSLSDLEAHGTSSGLDSTSPRPLSPFNESLRHGCD